MELMDVTDVYPGFMWPYPLRKAAELDLDDLDRWWLLPADFARSYFESMSERYPDRKVIPFAKCSYNDDVACFEADQGGRVFIVHDFASPGWERRQEYADFWEWFQSAIDEMIEEARYEERYEAEEGASGAVLCCEEEASAPACEDDVATEGERKSEFGYVSGLSAGAMGEIRHAAAQAAESLEIDVSGGAARIAEQIDSVVGVMLAQGVNPDMLGFADTAIGLSCLYGEAICERYGWSWMEFGSDEESAICGVVSPERNFCLSPMPYLMQILRGGNIGPDGENDNTVLLLFNMLDGIDERPGDDKMIPLQ